MSGPDRKPGSSKKPVSGLKTDGSLGDAKFDRLKRPVGSDGFLVDRPLSPEEEGLAGPLPDDEESEPPPRR